MSTFRLFSDFEPKGDQPEAIEKLFKDGALLDILPVQVEVDSNAVLSRPATAQGLQAISGWNTQFFEGPHTI